MTAAHCFFHDGTGQKRNNNEDLLVVLGSNDPIEETDDVIERGIDKFIQHPEYVYPEAYFDVGIVTLDGVVPPSAFKAARPICLPPKPNENPGMNSTKYGIKST